MKSPEGAERIVGNIRARAITLGLDGLRFTGAALPESVGQRYRTALATGDHGSMGLAGARSRPPPIAGSPLAQGADGHRLRAELRAGRDPLPELKRRDRGYVSVYARHRDYHDVLKGRLKELAGWIAARFACEVKVFVDTAPVLEKPLAQQAGLGWQGKHTNLVSRELRLLAVPGRDPDRPRAAAGRT